MVVIPLHAPLVARRLLVANIIVTLVVAIYAVEASGSHREVPSTEEQTVVSTVGVALAVTGKVVARVTGHTLGVSRVVSHPFYTVGVQGRGECLAGREVIGVLDGVSLANRANLVSIEDGLDKAVGNRGLGGRASVGGSIIGHCCFKGCTHAVRAVLVVARGVGGYRGLGRSHILENSSSSILVAGSASWG